MGVEVLVAPFEADAELAYLSKTGYVEAVLSEDGDQLELYSCDVVLNKFEMKAGTVQETGWHTIRAGLDKTIFKNLARDNLPQRMMEACLLEGGDYLASLDRIGLDTATALRFTKGRSIDQEGSLHQDGLCKSRRQVVQS